LAPIDTKLAVLRRKAAKNQVEVEHLTAFAAIGDRAAVPVVRELQAKYDWPRSNRVNGRHVVPLGRWAEVVCAYLEGGWDALIDYARGPEPDAFYFAISVLEVTKSPVSLVVLTELSSIISKKLSSRKADAVKLAEAINHVLSFKKPPPVYPGTATSLRRFLHALVRQKLTQPERATVVCALRGVGDEESIQIIRELPKFDGPWAGIEINACQTIRKRMKQ
jgi:hypothetical protein